MEIKIDTAMKYINIDDMNAIDIASEVIQDGGLIAYPTDTLYGLGCDAKNKQAIKKVNLIKNRKTPISVIVWSLEVAASWALISKKEFDEIINIKVRSTGRLLKAKINFSKDKARVKILDKETGISPGQACVFYSKDEFGDKVLGGGWIDKTFNNNLST